MTFWLNGAFQTDDIALSITDRGALLGDGLFETILVEEGTPVFFHEHMNRLKKSAADLAIPLPATDGTLQDVISVLAAEHAHSPICAARITLMRGPGPRGIVPPALKDAAPTLLVTLVPSAAKPPQALSYIIAHTRRNEGSPASRMKTLGYLDNVLAKQEAISAQAQEALMLNNRGEVVCSTIGNIFILSREGILTPEIKCGVLPGITRTKIIECAEELSVPLQETRINPDMLEGQPVFMTNSLMGMVKLTPVGAPALSWPAEHERLFLDLAARYAQKVRADIEGSLRA